ncbi:alpha,alpha-trehalase [Tremella mesenterica]|uniref:Trehalase n=1 Tax=Tremella mesenterica TaxID=5217 RepID=A0A4Q1BH99_TREME|nr:alpha,alpha-trehalase [Tremella mesenterica]
MWSLLTVYLLTQLTVTAQNITFSSASASSSFSPTPVTTSVPSPTGSLNDTVPGQNGYPPAQYWCKAGSNEPFCAGQLLQDVELSGIFGDSKTFSDKPTLHNLSETYAAFNQLTANVTVGQIEQFVEQYFKGEGLELEQVPIEGFNSTPALLNNISDPIYQGWVSVVNSYWTLLIRQTNQSALCNGDCESSLIPLNNTIVVPGDLLTNFMDFISVYGFVPNGGRIYYLNRSQPPMFVQMLDAYIQETGNLTMLERALPLASAEMLWWYNNRSITVTSPYTGLNRTVYHYSVTNTAPRPEGYQEDYETVMGTTPTLNDTGKADLYSELASGAESGWDYSARWCKQPVINISNNNPALRTLNVRAIVPVDLNSLLAGDHALLANLYEVYANSTNFINSTDSGNSTGSANSTDSSNSTTAYHRQMASNLSDAILDLHWDPAKSWFYDFNLTSNNRSELYTPAGTIPLWQNITPSEVVGNDTAALSVVSGARYLLGKYPGIPSVATLLYTGLNWDFPNSWPPHVYTSIKAFETLGRVNPNASVLTNLTLSFDNVTTGQLGLNESQLQPEDPSLGGNTTLQVQNTEGKPWPLALSVEWAERYMQAAFCTWYSTGGEIPNLLTQLPISQLNASGTYTAGTTGVMFEKFNITDPDASGGGGEYTVQVGFGWTNGVVLWLANEFGQYLPRPNCPLIPIIELENGKNVTVFGNGTEVNGTVYGNGTQMGIYTGYRIPRK